MVENSDSRLWVTLAACNLGLQKGSAARLLLLVVKANSACLASERSNVSSEYQPPSPFGLVV
jgi:hypothetical protein